MKKNIVKYIVLVLLANTINIFSMIREQNQVLPYTWHAPVFNANYQHSYEQCCCKYTLYLGSLAALAYAAARSSGLWEGQPLGNLEPSARCECCFCLPALLASINNFLDEPEPTHSCICGNFNNLRCRYVDLSPRLMVPRTKKIS